MALDEEEDGIVKQILRFKEVRLDLSMVMDKVASGCMTSDSGWLYDFRLWGERCLQNGSGGVIIVRMEVIPEGLPSVFSYSDGEGHVSRS